MLIYRFFILLFFGLICVANAQEILSLGTPYIEQFKKSNYKAGNQNWSIASDSQGIIYVANTNGLLVYDGSRWQLYPSHSTGALRSITIGADNKIYTGGKAEFGYWEQQEDGQLKYFSLSSSLDKAILKHDEIWKIIKHEGSYYFQSFSKCYVYKNGKITILDGSGEPFLFVHKYQESLFIEKIPAGLQQVKDKNLHSLPQALNNVYSILKYDDARSLVATANAGLFLMDKKGQVEPWNIPISSELKEAKINNGLAIGTQYFALGTIKSGIYIIDKEGQLIQHIHKANGLQNNTVLSLHLDQQGNIWAGLDNGIDRIEINSYFNFYTDLQGNIGTVYAIKVFKNKIYLGTNQGLFVSQLNKNKRYEKLIFKFIPQSHGQVWTLDIIQDQLICGHNEGTFIVDDSSLRRISSITGGWNNNAVIEDSNLFLQGNYTGLALFSKNGQWSFTKQYPDIKETVYKLIYKSPYHYWAILNSGISAIAFSPGFDKIQKLIHYPSTQKFTRITPFVLQNQQLFSTNLGLYRYDEILKQFQQYSNLNAVLGSFSKANYVKAVSPNTYWFANNGRYAFVKFSNEGKITVDSARFNSLEDRVMKQHEIVEPVDAVFLIGLDNGFAIFAPQKEGKAAIAAPIIRGLVDLEATDAQKAYLSLKEAIAYKQNNIKILFSSPWHSAGKVTYQYQLDGSKDSWSAASELAYKEFSKLTAGKHLFKVRAIAPDKSISATTELEFTILRPWYWQTAALILYALLLLVVGYFVRIAVLHKIAKDKDAIHKRLLKKQEQRLRKDTQMHEQKIAKLQLDQMQQELELKRRELANAAMNIVYKNEMLNTLHDELLHIKDADGRKLNAEQLTKIKKLIGDAHNDDRDWDLFEKSFNEAHGNFFKKMKVDFPELSPNDLKLCAYLRLNMSSKEIASLLNITTRGVEIRRYRLRKKLNLPTDKNISEFLLER